MEKNSGMNYGWCDHMKCNGFIHAGLNKAHSAVLAQANQPDHFVVRLNGNLIQLQCIECYETEEKKDLRAMADSLAIARSVQLN